MSIGLFYKNVGEFTRRVSDCEEISFEWKLKGGLHGNANY